jgi:hypothetical protein
VDSQIHVRAHLGIGEGWQAEEQGVQGTCPTASAVGRIHAEMEAALALLAPDRLGFPHEAEGHAAPCPEHAGQVARSSRSCQGGHSFITPQPRLDRTKVEGVCRRDSCRLIRLADGETRTAKTQLEWPRLFPNLPASRCSGSGALADLFSPARDCHRGAPHLCSQLSLGEPLSFLRRLLTFSVRGCTAEGESSLFSTRSTCRAMLLSFSWSSSAAACLRRCRRMAERFLLVAFIC